MKYQDHERGYAKATTAAVEKENKAVSSGIG